MFILAIETSCDETAIALVYATGGLRAPTFKVLKNFVSSQINIHRPFGGVVPGLAKREHLKNLPEIFKNLKLETKNFKPDAIAVTVGPGLEPALWTGIEFAKQLHSSLTSADTQRRPTQKKVGVSPRMSLRKSAKPLLMGVNHIQGHLYSNWLPRGIGHPERERRISRDSSSDHGRIQNDKKIQFPAIALVVSGGHTILLYMTSLTKWKKLGETRDDAAGEAFDKIARLLGLPYPGGPEIERLAKRGKGTAIDFPRPMLNQKNYEFSFSGLKTSVLYYLRDNPKAKKADVAASVQQAIIDVLVKKTMRAAREFRVKSVLLCGGVAANRALRDNLQLITNNLKLKFFVPPFEYNTDNAAMIAAAAYIGHLRGKKYRITAQPNLNL